MPAKTVDEYLDNLDPDKRALLTKVHKAVHETCPTAVELISWKVPFFKYKGK